MLGLTFSLCLFNWHVSVILSSYFVPVSFPGKVKYLSVMYSESSIIPRPPSQAALGGKAGLLGGEGGVQELTETGLPPARGLLVAFLLSRGSSSPPPSSETLRSLSTVAVWKLVFVQEKRRNEVSW